MGRWCGVLRTRRSSTWCRAQRLAGALRVTVHGADWRCGRMWPGGRQKDARVPIVATTACTVKIRPSGSKRRRRRSVRPGKWCPSGASGSSRSASLASKTSPAEVALRSFPPDAIIAIKALACELPASTGVPLSRWHCPELARAAIADGIVASVSGTTIWRWLSRDAIRLWQHRSWIFPRYAKLFIARAMRSSGLCRARPPETRRTVWVEGVRGAHASHSYRVSRKVRSRSGAV